MGTPIGGVIFTGVGIGFWLQKKLGDTNQNVKLPGAFKAEE
jgi:hypothetical protein